MSKIIFVDSSVFIWAYNRPKSNSAKILELMDEGELSVTISERVLEELKTYFLRYYSERVWFSVFKHVVSCVEVVKRDEISEEISKWKGKIKGKDIEHLATVKHLGLKYLVAVDDDFKNFEEYKTPRQFIQLMGLKPSESEY